jgi:hypothetical protein
MDMQLIGLAPLDAIAATPEVRRTKVELQAVARGDVVEAAEAVKR